LFDTAEIYGLGRSERILGRALQGHGDVPFVATKIFPVLPLAPVVEQRGVASAQRLGLRHLDLYQVHQPNPIVRDRTTMRGMRALQDVGLVGAIGVSNYSLERWRRCEAALGGPVLSNQVRYNLVDRRAERDVIPYAEAQGRVVIAYSPLAQGFLSGRYDASTRPTGFVRRRSKLFRPDTLERAATLFDALRTVADAHTATPAQVALAWAIRWPNVVAIPGASSVEQVESNAAAADLDLHDDEIRALSDAATTVTSTV
jgi:aryl-alcohol dehydrogenase-like predicted oxidoreductase